MKRMLFNATQQEESRVAIVDGQKLINLDIETLGREQRKGNIYKGKITKVEPSLEACFVDYGTPRQGFLPFKEIHRSYFSGNTRGRVKIQDAVKEGTEVLVQVEKDERGNKGAALTTYISLAGRYLVLMPNNPRGGGVSRRVEGQERIELKNIINQLQIPAGMSVIARTAGIGRSLEELQWDLDYQLKLWDAVKTAGEQENIQPLILQESALVIRAIRDYFQPDIGEIIIDNKEVFDKIYQFISFVMPQNLSKVKFYQDPIPLFSRFQIESQIDSVYSRQVSLPSGGEIVIDHTEALVAVDVNSAKSTKGADVEETALRTNLEAAEELSRQLSLRDIGGLVVVDFIDMEDPRHQREVENALRNFLKDDRARVQTTKLSRFGLMEISRQRLQVALGETTHMACPRCHGTGVIRSVQSSALHVLRVIEEKAMKENTGEVRAQLPVDVATFLLNEKREQIFNLEARLDVPVVIIPNKYLETPHYVVERIRLDEVEGDALSYTLVEQPEEEEYESNSQKIRESGQVQAAVQGITPSAPAPRERAQKSSMWQGLSTWFKHVFAASEATSAAEDTGAADNLRSRNGNGERRRRQNKNYNRRDNSGSSETTSSASLSPNLKVVSATKTEETAAKNKSGGSSRRGQNKKEGTRADSSSRGRKKTAPPLDKNATDEVASTHDAKPTTPPREEAATPAAKNEKRPTRGPREGGRSRTRIPKADYIEGRVDVDKISRHVKRIATAVLKDDVTVQSTATAVNGAGVNAAGKTVTTATIVVGDASGNATAETVTAATVFVGDSFKNEAAKTATPPEKVKSAPAAKKEASVNAATTSADGTSGVKLKMVETKAKRSAKPAPATPAVTPRKRRSDVAAKAVSEEVEAAPELHQIETKK